MDTKRNYLLKITNLSQEFIDAGIEPQVIERLIKSSYSVSLKKGDCFHACDEGAMLIYFRSGCLFDVLNISEDYLSTSLLWTPGYITVTLPKELNQFENKSYYYICLIDAEITVIPKTAIYREQQISKQLFNFILQRSSEYLFASRDMALMRATLDKKENIALRLIVMYISMEGVNFSLTIDDLSLLAGTNRKYCSEYIATLQGKGILEKGYGKVTIIDFVKLKRELDPKIINFFSNYLRLKKIN
ncbi:Crp/Fnr family transcriptional regulator [Shewanella sp. MF05960]|uniref:Crp/Fnr family transcriptional regulator n=1 Tax=Shewanella sp. MF05960 TaxID=3434874 RepID=UPI003D7AE509